MRHFMAVFIMLILLCDATAATQAQSDQITKETINDLIAMTTFYIPDSTEITTFELSPDGRTLAMDVSSHVDWTNSVWITDIATQTTHTLYKRDAYSTVLTFSPDSRYLVIQDSTGTQLWDLKTEQRRSQFDIVTTSAPPRFSRDGKLLALGGYGVDLVDVASGQILASIAANGTFAFDPAPLQDGSYLLIVVGSGQVNSYDVTIGDYGALVNQRAHAAKPGRDILELVHVMGISPDGNMFAAASGDEDKDQFGFELWDVSQMAVSSLFWDHQSNVSTLSYTVDGSMVVTSTDNFIGRDKRVAFWDAKTGQLLRELYSGLDDAPVHFGLSASTLIMQTAHNALQLWGLASDRASGQTLGGSLQGTLAVDEHFDKTFTANQGDIVTLTVRGTGGNLDPYLEMLDSQQQIVAENDNHASESLDLTFKDAQIIQTLNQAGEYTIRVSGVQGTSGSFDLSVEQVVSGSAYQPEASLSPGASLTGRVAYVSAPNGYNDVFVLENGIVRPLVDDQIPKTTANWSPDGKKIAYVELSEQTSDLVVLDLESGVKQMLTSNSGRNLAPRWSPDGKRLVFTSDRDGNSEIYTVDSDGANAQRLTTNTIDDLALDWSPDGKTILFVSNREGSEHLYFMDTNGKNLKRLTKEFQNEYDGTWSPDGSQLAISAIHDYSDYRPQIYLVSAEGTLLKRATSEDESHSWPRWSSDGQTLLYSVNQFSIYMMPLNTQAATLVQAGAVYADWSGGTASSEQSFWTQQELPALPPALQLPPLDTLLQGEISFGQMVRTAKNNDVPSVWWFKAEAQDHIRATFVLPDDVYSSQFYMNLYAPDGTLVTQVDGFDQIIEAVVETSGWYRLTIETDEPPSAFTLQLERLN